MPGAFQPSESVTSRRTLAGRRDEAQQTWNRRFGVYTRCCEEKRVNHPGRMGQIVEEIDHGRTAVAESAPARRHGVAATAVDANPRGNIL